MLQSATLCLQPYGRQSQNMPFELFQEGGPLRAKRTGKDQYSMSVSIPKDEDGRVARECPNHECSPGYFKVKLGTGITNGQTVAYCPYCQKSAEPSDFHTKEPKVTTLFK